MAFVTTETWEVASPPGAGIELPRWLSGRWATRALALILSLVIDIALIAALILAGTIAMPRTGSRNHSITTIDLPSPNNAAAGAATAQPAPTPPLPPTKIEVTTASPIPTEWSVTKLPPLPAPASPAAPAAASVAQTGSGTAQSGSAASSGYDPYAFASYRPPSAGRLSAANAGSTSLSVPASSLNRLELLLRERLHLQGRPVEIRFGIDSGGRITRTEIVDLLPPSVTAQLSAMAQGFALLGADPTRPADATTIVTVRL